MVDSYRRPVTSTKPADSLTLGRRLLYTVDASDKALATFAHRLCQAAIEGLALHALSEFGGGASYQCEDLSTKQTPAPDCVEVALADELCPLRQDKT